MVDAEFNFEDRLLQIQSALDDEHIQEAVDLVLDLHPADRAVIFNQLDDEDQGAILAQLDNAAMADLFEELPDREALEAAETMPTERLADVLDEMEPDEAADLLGERRSSERRRDRRVAEHTLRLGGRDQAPPNRSRRERHRRKHIPRSAR